MLFKTGLFIRLPHYFILLCYLSLLCSCQSDTTLVTTADGKQEINNDELLKTLGEIYVYGYPLVLMDLTKEFVTNTEQPHPTKPLAPLNQLGHSRQFPDHTQRAVVKPNLDTYYSSAWFDLKKEPYILSMPATERYYVLPFYDAYSNIFASIGPRTTGTKAQHLLIAGPDWKGEIPDSCTLLQSPTQMAWMIARIQANNDEDGATVVRAIQDSMRLVPVSAFGKSNYTPSKGTVNPQFSALPPSKRIQEIDIYSYLNRLSKLMADNPPMPEDAPMLAKMAKIGFVPGQDFNLQPNGWILKFKINKIPNFIHDKFNTRRLNPDTNNLINGWNYVTEGIGQYGTDYIRRAYIAYIGIGALQPEDAVYPNCTFDKNGHSLDASKQYQIHFEPDQIPPNNAFWSITPYDADEFLIKNELNRFALSSKDGLQFNIDGSLDLYIQNKPPKVEFQSNWLPIPEDGPFYLTMRLYRPKKVVLDRVWDIPAVVPLE